MYSQVCPGSWAMTGRGLLPERESKQESGNDSFRSRDWRMNEPAAQQGRGTFSSHKSHSTLHSGSVTTQDQSVTKITEVSDQLVSLDWGKEGGRVILLAPSQPPLCSGPPRGLSAGTGGDNGLSGPVSAIPAWHSLCPAHGSFPGPQGTLWVLLWPSLP